MTRKLQVVGGSEPAKRRRPPPVQKTHDEIYKLIEETDARAKTAVDEAASLRMSVEEIKETLSSEFFKISKLIGSSDTDERGELVGTGIVGHIARLERKVDSKFRSFDGWFMFGRGLLLASLILGPVIYWLVTTHVSIKFGE